MKTYILEPLNERQEMNCRVEVKGTKAYACGKAKTMASVLQDQLTGNAITVRIRDEAKSPDDFHLIATNDGRILNEANGEEVSI